MNGFALLVMCAISLSVFSRPAGAVDYSYLCTSKVTFAEALILSTDADARTVYVHSLKKDQYQGISYLADMDFSYRPKIEGRLRFLARDVGKDYTEVIIDGSLMSGGTSVGGDRGGFMRLQGFLHGYWHSDYHCSERK